MLPKDPHRLYSPTVEAPPVLTEYRRRAAQAGLVTALSAEGVVVTVLLIAGKSMVAFGLLDGADEVCGCVAMIVGGLLSFAGWGIGSAIGTARYLQAMRDWEQQHQGEVGRHQG